MKNVNPYIPLPNALPRLERIPHIAPYIKGLRDKKGVYHPLLKDESTLFQWYESLLEQAEDENYTSNKSKEMAELLVKGLNTDEEKINAIYSWTQKNIQYLAYEYAMGGFIPRPAGKTFENTSGDCKDMSLLMTEMLNHIGIPAKFSWVGTRDRSYTYSELPTPMVDNHAIVVIPLTDTVYILDATNRFVPLGHPPTMIQGKEIMVYMDTGNYSIFQAPIMSAHSNRRKTQWTIKPMENNNWLGSFETKVYGYAKEQFLEAIFNSKTEPERNFQIAQFLLNNNPKTFLKTFNFESNTRELKPSHASGIVSLNNATREIEGNTYLRPVIVNFFDGYSIPSRRTETFILKNTLYFEDTFTIQLPDKAKISKFPEEIDIDNKLIKAKFSVKQVDDQTIEISTIQAIKVIRIDPEDFEEWNTAMKVFEQISNVTLIFN
ncbi:MAG: DUF3858 domain-containing protein [Cryomorphaceae bacterium]|nr:DUF3858 domain-containing protein [Cryomorphaceae bacterium]